MLTNEQKLKLAELKLRQEQTEVLSREKPIYNETKIFVNVEGDVESFDIDDMANEIKILKAEIKQANEEIAEIWKIVR